MIAKRLWSAALTAVAGAIAAPAFAAATLVIQNFNVPGVGFNDPTPAAPVGGNMGTTLGQQRLNAFAYAASIWGANIDTPIPILIRASMTPLTCTATSAVLGSAGPSFIVSDFGAGEPGYIYPFALANKLVGEDLGPGLRQITARFNSELGKPGCLTGSGFYLGLDRNAGGGIDLVTVLLHEFGHGLGFLTFSDGVSGAQTGGLPSIFDKFAFDNTVGKAWDQMTNAERQFSALNSRGLVWTGANVTSNAPSVLLNGTPELVVNAPSSVAGTYLAGIASFGQRLDAPGLNRQVMQVVDQADGRGLACNALDAANTRAVKNRIALVDRGTCGFVLKAKNVQNAGAVGMIVVDNVAGGPPPDMSGADPTVFIPSVRVTNATGTALKAAINDTASGRSSGLVARMGVNASQLAGADAQGRVMLFTPNPFQGGSSVSHWDTSAFRNLLMEPFINADLLHAVAPPNDLTLPMLKDMGW